MSKKIKFLLSLTLILILIFIGSFAYATLNDYYIAQTQEETIKSAVATEVNSVLSALGEPTTKSLKSTSNISLDAKKDVYRDINYYSVSTQDYKINLDTSTNKVVNIFKLDCDLTTQTASTKEEAKNFITEKYSELKLPTEYELMYLEPFMTTLWEADFQKNYDGVYSMYEAVKVIFNPATEEILALTVFDEDYAENTVAKTSMISESTSETNVADSILNNAISALSIDEESIENIETTFIKPSTLSNSDTNDTSIHKAKVIRYSTIENNIEIVRLSYIDFYTGEFLGGDMKK